MAHPKEKISLNSRQGTAGASKSRKKTGAANRTGLRFPAFFSGDAAVGTPLILRFVFGTILGILALYLLFSFGSYLVNGAANQSLFIDNAEGVDAAGAVRGNVGVQGSKLMHNVVDGWLGFGFLFIIYLIGIVGLSMVITLRINLLKQILFSVTMAFWTSLALSMLPEAWLTGWFFLPGGVLGQMMARSLTEAIGTVGVWLLLILVLALLLFLTFHSLQERYGRWSLRRKELLSRPPAERRPAPPAPQPEEEEEEEDFETGGGEPLFPQQEPLPAPVPSEAETRYPEDTSGLSKETDPKSESNPVSGEHSGATTAGAETPTSGEVKLEVVDNRHIEEEAEDAKGGLTAADLVEKLGPYDPRKELSGYRFPTLDLLKKYDQDNSEIDQEEIQANKDLITSTFKSFNIDILSITATVGPAITLYEVVPAAGVHISKIRGLEENIAMSLSALGIRIIAPMPGKGTIGLEVPNKKPQIVSMRSVIASNRFQTSSADLPIALGRTITNEVFVFDLAKAPHLLVAGATGQGKSVGLNAIITSLLYTKHPSELKFVMVDPKMVEFSMYALIEKHYMAKLPGEEQVIITDTKRVAVTLNSLCQEMDDRYELLAAAHVRNIKEYNEMFVNRRLNPMKGHRYLPYIVLIIDEYGDLLITAGKEIEIPITRLAQKARAIGIHAIIATQRPTAKIITGAIKANFPGRIAFRVTSGVDSRIILDTTGANRLVGKGDLLFQNGSNMTRIQCAFVDTPEVNAIVDYIADQRGYAEAYELPEPEDENGSDARPAGDGSGMVLDPNEKDEIYDEVARMLVLEGRASISLIQQKFSIGYNRAARLMNQLVAGGVVTPKDGNKPQEVIPSSIEELDRY